ncbi:ABC transporter ATP-binding protein [bacterium]|nr:MAG: ABC transporter ATP-binding protein [bacterium]
MTAPALCARGLGKLFHHRLPRYASLAGRLRLWTEGGRGSLPVWALRDVSFELARGECLGVAGPNGSGKSTLLALLAGILEPTEGSVSVAGRVSTLININAGLQPDLSVSDNVEIFAVLMGLRRREALRRVPAVLEFAGLSGLAEVRMGELSTGQVARVAFSAAVHADLDVLLVDEALSVGDAAFQEKCRGAFERLRGEGKTMVVISHDEGLLRGLCTRILRLDAGRAAALEAVG